MGSSFVAHPRHGPLPAVLLVLTFGTGIVDAVSILGLGRVFVANMTGNVVFIGFGIAGAPGFSILGSSVALIAFVLGATAGGIVIARHEEHRGRLLRDSLTVQFVLFVVATIVAVAAGGRAGVSAQAAILALVAFALGLQNAVVRRLAVPDMTTTVLTMTITGIAADLRRGDRTTAARRLIVVLAMLLGAVVGAVVVLRGSLGWGLALQAALLLTALIATAIVSRGTRAWHSPQAVG
ncbi:MAG: DUF1275 domain-containing protein [Acidobacteria bacterium]|nr:DUF1275 domain-containing protein [Acidobacteriota bacterium]